MSGADDGELSSADIEVARRVYAVLRVVSGVDPDLRERLNRLADELHRSVVPHPVTPSAPALTARELDAVALVAVGYKNSEIAQLMGVAPETVKSYLRSAMNKSETRSRHALLAVARRSGLIP
ncbi:LuxR C-terminal-related transcriptional regulator [Pseudonocardia sp. NPDC049635]|uniref:response regulator transcription factor n=1 Tax=Pseudonocardia sp. NPDC049635 TaxID=3155506 RepID=UPI0033C00024